MDEGRDKGPLRKNQGNIPSYVVIVKRIYCIRLITKDYMLSYQLLYIVHPYVSEPE